MNKLKEICRLYANLKMLTMTAFGFASGFPFLLIYGTLTSWLKDAGWTYAAIGAFSLIKIPYALKWLWSPILDQVRLPWLDRLGRRRSWGIVLQICVFISILLMSAVDPSLHPRRLYFAALAVCLSSASLDIVLDAYRVECFSDRPEDQSAASAMFVLGYRLGLIFSGAGALMLADCFDWNFVYVIMSIGSLIGFIALLCVKERPLQRITENKKSEPLYYRLGQFFRHSVADPLIDFVSHAHWPLILFLIFIYRMSDAYIAPMAFPFYMDMGFSKTEIALVIKVYGMIAAIIGGLFGGIVVKKYGLWKGLYICAWTQGLTTLIFSFQALVGHHLPALIITIALENFSSGMATTALVGYISSLCSLRYTATQYALLSSIMSLSRDMLAATSGKLAEAVSWPIFFVIAAAFSLFGIATLHALKPKISA